MIEAIRIQNLRSLKDTGFIDIKPLTILVGVNSSGKSTFLRSFPLFTQSINKTLRGVVSWFDDSFVDFGNYSTAKSKFAENSDTIKFSYKINLNRSDNFRRRLYYENKYTEIDKINNFEVELSFKNSNFDNETYVNSILLRINESLTFCAFIDKSNKVKFKINDVLVPLQYDYKFTHHNNGLHILPSVIASSENDSETENINHAVISINGVLYPYVPIYIREIEQLFKEYQPKFKLNKSNLNKIDTLINKWSFNKNDYLATTKEIKINNTIDKKIELWDIGNKEFEKVYSIAFIQKMLSFFDVIDEEISYYYIGCSYIAPARAGANRYFRDQGLQVSDIDPYGRNLPEFLKSIKDRERKSYDDFIKKVLNIKVEAKSTTEGLSLLLSPIDGSKTGFNIADVGFGYSQILPIVTKLWWWYENNGGLTNYYRISVSPTILIEQPELHLHPAYQAKIADAFINSVIKKNAESTEHDYRQRERMNLIIETHSQTIINRIGRRIYEGYLSPDDVNVVIFEKDYDKPCSVVKQTNFDKKGKIANWPRGFFDPLDEPLFN